MIISATNPFETVQFGAEKKGLGAEKKSVGDLILQGRAALAQTDINFVKSAADTIKEMEAKAAEKAEKEGKEKTGEGSETTAKTDGIKDPSEVTKADIQSPIDIKL